MSCRWEGVDSLSSISYFTTNGCTPDYRGIAIHNTYIVTGTLTDARTVKLDEALPLTPTKVRLVVEPLSPASQRPYQEVMAEIRARQLSRGHRPPSQEEVDAYLRTEQDSWEEGPCT